MQNKLCDFSFSEKVRIYSFDYLKCLRYILSFEDSTFIYTKKLYAKLISTSQLLEDFLDFHGAKNNSNWYYYRELAAAIRHLSLSAFAQKHILNRLSFYEISNLEIFKEQGAVNLSFLNRTLEKLAYAIVEEAKRLSITIPESTYKQDFFPSVLTNDILAYDIDDENKDLQKKKIVKIASDFLSIADNFDQLGLYQPLDEKKLKEIVPEKVNEVEIRRFEMLVHNLQSSFDTYVIHGGYRYGDRKLKLLRSHFSVVFHLLKVVGRLLHFYERHLLERGYKDTYKKVRERLSVIIDPHELLDRTINHGLFYACQFLTTGKDLAREIINENIERAVITVGIPVKLGFHSRPSLLVAKIVQHYGGQVLLCVGSDEFDASSVLDIQWAGGKIQKEQVTKVTFKGDARSLKDIEVLAGVNYGEDTMGKGIPLPKELHYLK